MDKLMDEHTRELAYQREERDEQRLLTLEIQTLELDFNQE